MEKEKPQATPSKDAIRIGHVHLTVSDLPASIAFYRDVLGFELTQQIGTQAAFLSSGGYHHTIGLNTWSQPHAQKPHDGQIGLYHVAILYPNRKELARALQRLLNTKWPLDGAADHGVSESIYLKDPDGNGLELYADRPEDQWPRDQDGKLKMVTEPLDVDGLLKEAD